MIVTFHSLEIGTRLTGRVTVTEAHVLLASGIFADIAPLHVDDVYAKGTRYGGRAAHGPLIIGIMTGLLGTQIGETATGLLEVNARFHAPVLINQTVTTEWEVIEKVEKPRLGGGIVKLAGAASTEDDTTAVTAEVTMVVAYGDTTA